MTKNFELKSDYSPKSDQHQAISKLVKSIKADNKHQTLWGVTGSGKTFTMANIIQEINRPILVLSHNKTLAAQLYSEFKNFFPNNSVEYFVSYFDYYQPEAYIPSTDTYIEKDSSINDDIERLRLSSMGSLLTRPDTLIVASISCIYGLGSPEEYANMTVPIHEGMIIERDELLKNLVDIFYERNDVEFQRSKFRVRGDVVEVFPAYLENEAIRIEFFGDEIERICSINPLTGNIFSKNLSGYTFYPAKQFVTSKDKLPTAMKNIRIELEQRIDELEKQNKLVEAQRLKQRTEYDLEMINEMGYCSGIENYSRHLTFRKSGETPYTLLDFFTDNFLFIIDESHASLPQMQAMYAGDRSRKSTLIDHGFRLPSALDNRPLQFHEVMAKNSQFLYVSATPSNYELINSYVGNTSYIDLKQAKTANCSNIKASASSEKCEDFNVKQKGTPLIVEQIIRPTGLLDPEIIIKPLNGQIDETIELCRQTIQKKQRILITTLTKRTAEDLTDYLRDLDLKVQYIHSDVDAIERVELLRSLRKAEFDILVGINLLREGLDLPEVSLVCILDADKEGFLRSETSLIQTAGRAARHENGKVILFADNVTKSIKKLIAISDYRRQKQSDYNKKHKITPKSVSRPVQASLNTLIKSSKNKNLSKDNKEINIEGIIAELKSEMAEAVAKLEFERAAHIRDQIKELQTN